MNVIYIKFIPKLKYIIILLNNTVLSKKIHIYIKETNFIK